MLLAYLVLWFGCLMAIGLVLQKLFVKFAAPIFEKKAKKFERILKATQIVQNAGEYSTKELLLTYFLHEDEKGSYKQRNFHGDLSSEIFQSLLKKFFAVEVISEVCEWDRRSCFHAIKAVAPGGSTFFLTFNTGVMSWRNNVRDLFKKTVEDENVVTIDENDYFEIIRSLTLIHGAGVDENSADMQALLNCLSSAEVERVYVKTIEEKTTNVVRFAYHPVAGYYLQDTPQQIKIYDDEVIDASYNNMTLDYQGQKQEVLPHQALEVARVALLNGQNIFTFGTMGCGKTTFARQILAGLEDTAGVRLISITPAMIGHLQQPAAQAALINLLSTSEEVTEYDYETHEFTVKNVKTLNIIFIDEAEVLLAKSDNGLHTEAQSFLLSLMDGELRDILNARVLFVFNKDKQFLNPTIFRSCRGGLEFNVTPISMERAKTLVGLLKSQNVKLRFDEQKFHNFITSQSLTSDGTLYAAAGSTTLADVVSCFTEPELDDAVIVALRGMKIPKPQPKVDTSKVISEAKPALYIKPKTHTLKVAAKTDNVPSINEKFAVNPVAVEEKSVVTAVPTKTEQKHRNRWRKGKKK